METIYASLIGRIGNNLFQIAAVASLAKKNHCNFVGIAKPLYYLPSPDNCVLREYLLQFEDNLLRNIGNMETLDPETYELYEEPFYHYQEIPYKENLLISGYFQSEKYFDEPLVRELFRIDDKTKETLYSKYGELLNNEVTSINVRRGDYLNVQNYHPVCPLEYFERAIDRIGRDKQYLITSDDLPWCKEHFRGNNFNFADRVDPVENLYLQSLCRNNILSNSSYSWW
ncbi:MAG: alpha-1,2-fucosyltransferase, partial [Bacteroidaceae bacterium]